MDLFTLSAKLQLDKSNYEQGLRDSESMASKAGGAISGALGASAKAAVAGIVATTTAVAGLVKSSVDGYSEFEQLQGGIETLFGESANVVMENAKKAYKTAGKDANDYMNTVVGMAGALNKATSDVEKSAELADMAIVDMSDNVNKMGTSMEMVQNAYTGFSRGNFTMLDNLALGFAGTKEGMQELLDSAQAISGVQYDISSYADIVEAIHVVQTEMGITGTTSKEAATTIQGSINMTIEAWENLVTGLTNPDADISELIDNLVDSAKNAASNLIPAVKQALTGVASLVKEIAPIIADELPSLVNDVLPMLIDTGISLFKGLVDALPTILEVLIKQAPTIINAIVDAIIDLLPVIIELGLDLVLALAKGLVEAIPQLIPAITEMITGIVEMLTEPDTLIQLVMAAIQIMLAIQQGMINAIPQLLEAVPVIIGNLIKAIVKLFPLVVKTGVQMLTKFGEGIKLYISTVVSIIVDMMLKLINAIKDKFESLKQKGREIVDSVKNGIMEKVHEAETWGKDLIQNFIDGILAKWNDLKDTVRNVAQSVKDFIGFSEPKMGPLSNFHTYAPDMMDLFIKGVNDNKGRLVDTVANAFDFENAIVRPYDIDVNGTSARNISGGNVYNININQPVDTADNLARVIREEAQYGLIGGVGFGY